MAIETAAQPLPQTPATTTKTFLRMWDHSLATVTV